MRKITSYRLHSDNRSIYIDNDSTLKRIVITTQDTSSGKEQSTYQSISMDYEEVLELRDCLNELKSTLL